VLSSQVINSYRFGGGGISDEKLALYWKFNEPSGNIFNSSLSSDSLGNTTSTGQGIMTGGSYEQGGSPIGNSVLMDGTDDYLTAGSTKSLWDFWHDSDALWTMCWWIKGVDFGWDSYFVADGNGSESQCLRIRFNGQTTYTGLNFVVKSGGTSNYIINESTVANFIPNVTTWYFISVSFDMSLSSDNMSIKLNDNNEKLMSKSADTTADGNADFVPVMAKRTDTSANFGNFLISEYSLWKKVDADLITQLYANGNGLEIY